MAFNPVIYYFWGTLIIVLSLMYALATVAFGYRMSNLTFRGIITSGLYRYSKHPAYISKVLSWWLIYLPFFSIDGTWDAVRHTANLCLITLIYYLRARTEENHLSNYPEYVAYANWVNDHGALRLVGKFFPFFKYSEERAKRWKSVVWFKKVNPA
jgi:steroid 5-alpha reductase family enzyme